MARKPKNANIDIRQSARVFDEQVFVDGVFNDDYILTVMTDENPHVENKTFEDY